MIGQITFWGFILVAHLAIGIQFAKLARDVYKGWDEAESDSPGDVAYWGHRMFLFPVSFLEKNPPFLKRTIAVQIVTALFWELRVVWFIFVICIVAAWALLITGIILICRIIKSVVALFSAL